MSDLSNNQGRAYEFACLMGLEQEISKVRAVAIEKNSSYYAAERAWNSIGQSLQRTFETSAMAGILSIFELEPLILEDGNDTLDLLIQPDDKGKSGDVRDVLIIRRGIEWEIGLSIKHNHFAVKHSRLAKSLDFGDKWFGVKCSKQYWDDVEPIFSYLEKEKAKGSKWRDLPSKEDDVYVPLLTAFLGELKRSNEAHGTVIPRKMVEYLLGEFDFYKVIGIDSKRITQIQAFNLRGTLNTSGKSQKPKIQIPVSSLPTRIVNADFRPGSSNTVELYLNAGWQFGFRIHNAATNVETSLKFDIQIIGMPTTIISIDCKWGKM
jgi:hypothetical protein